MRNSIKYKTSFWLFSVSIVLFSVVAIVSLVGGNNVSVEAICLFLGFSIFSVGQVLLRKSQNKAKIISKFVR